MIFAKPKPTPKPSEVFTPTRLPLAEGNAYSRRGQAESLIRRFLDRDQVPVVFGEYGVGKTTVVKKVLRERTDEDGLIYLPTASGKSMSDVFTLALEALGFSVETGEVSTDASSGKFGAKLFIDAGAEFSSSTTTTSRLVVDSPTDASIAKLLREKRITIVIDELHRASSEFRAEIADLIKTTHGQESNFPQIILIGTTLDSSVLVANDQGIDRFVKELRVSPMNDDEANLLIQSGYDTLGIAVSTELKLLVVRTAAGAPSLIQSLCLDMAESCVAGGRSILDDSDYKFAVELYLKEHGHRLAEVYNSAIEHTGPRKYRKQILISMSLMDDEFFELEDVRVHIQERSGLPVQQTALSGPLREFKAGRGEYSAGY